VEALLLSVGAHVTIGRLGAVHMLARTTILVLAAGVAALALTGWTGGSGSPHASRSADNSPGAVAVDAELVIAVDVSNSMDPEE
jgi:hypothetical protein